MRRSTGKARSVSRPQLSSPDAPGSGAPGRLLDDGVGVVSFGAYADAWLKRRATHVAPRTTETYAWSLSRYLLPTLGDVALDAITRAMLCRLFDRMAERGLSMETVRLAVAVVTAIFNDAVEAERVAGSPVGHLKRRYRASRRADVAAYDERQATRFLDAAFRIEPNLAPLFALCARAGLRCGEVRALRSEDLDLPARRLHVRRQLDRRRGLPSPPKSGRPRVVDLAASLVRILEPLAARRPEWLFPEVGGVSGYKLIWKAMRQIAQDAELATMSIHSLRHHYASLLLSKNVSPVYVQRQLGHAGISLTVDLYGRHIPMPRPPVLDEL